MKKKFTTPKLIILVLAACVTCSVYAQQTQKKRTKRAEKKFVPPVIVNDTIDETTYQISVVEVDDSDAIDIRELERSRVIVEEPRDKPFVFVENMPLYPGGEVEMRDFIKENLRYPVISAESGIQGRVIVRFVINKDGSVSDAVVVRGIDPSCDKEALRVVRSMPKWIAGKQNGKDVSVFFTLPIIFRLDEIKIDKSQPKTSSSEETVAP